MNAGLCPSMFVTQQSMFVWRHVCECEGVVQPLRALVPVESEPPHPPNPHPLAVTIFSLFPSCLVTRVFLYST